MGLLSRFELGTDLPESGLSGSPQDLTIEMRRAHGMRFPVLPAIKETLRNPKVSEGLELLSRFELETSSLPRNERLTPLEERSTFWHKQR